MIKVSTNTMKISAQELREAIKNRPMQRERKLIAHSGFPLWSFAIVHNPGLIRAMNSQAITNRPWYANLYPAS